MTSKDSWGKLGWRHPVWEMVRYYCSLVKNKKEQAAWLAELESASKMKVGDSADLPIDHGDVKLFFDYIKAREEDFAIIFGKLRSQDDAVRACDERKTAVKFTTTKNQEHHQSPKAVIALVDSIVEKVCKAKGLNSNTNPQTRCVWCKENRLHVTARNVDGAIPGLANPTIIWEIKEYWGGTGGGSKMSDAVYECNLVGRELREFEEIVKVKVVHMVFVDGLVQWTSRKSDLKRFIDLTHQGLIDYLFAGKDIETEFESVLSALLS